MCQQTKFGINAVTEWDFMGDQKHLFWAIFEHFHGFKAPTKTPLNTPIDPNFFLWAVFDCNLNIF